MNLDDVAHRLAAMPDQEREGVLASALRLTSSFAWTPDLIDAVDTAAELLLEPKRDVFGLRVIRGG